MLAHRTVKVDGFCGGDFELHGCLVLIVGGVKVSRPEITVFIVFAWCAEGTTDNGMIAMPDEFDRISHICRDGVRFVLGNTVLSHGDQDLSSDIFLSEDTAS